MLKANKQSGLILSLLGVLLILFWFLKHIVAYLIISAVLSLMGAPVVRFLSKLKMGKISLPKSLCAAITILLMWGVFIGFLAAIIPLVANQVNEFTNINVGEITEHMKFQLVNLYSNIDALLEYSGSNQNGHEFFQEKITSILSFAQISSIINVLSLALGNIVIAIFCILFITFFFLKEEDLFISAILGSVPDDYVLKVTNIILSVRKLLTRYFLGLMLEMCSIMILVTAGLSMVGLTFSQAVFIGFFAGCFNIVPYLGPMVSTVLGLLLGTVINIEYFIYDSLPVMLGYIAIVFIATYVFNNFVTQPFIYSNSVYAHPLEVFLVILIAGSLAGIPGLVFAIPTYTIIRIIAKEFFSSFKIVKNLTKKM